MNHEIVGPEVTQVTGQLRIPKDIAIAKHIAQFWNPPEWNEPSKEQRQAEERQKRLEQEMSRVTGLEYSALLDLPWAQQNLLGGLHKAGNDEAARIIAHDLSLTEREPLIHQLMVKTQAVRMYELRHQGDDWDYARTGVSREELMPVLKEIVKTNADWPTRRDDWQKELRKDLKVLVRKVYHWTDGIAMSGNSVYWTIDREKRSKE